MGHTSDGDDDEGRVLLVDAILAARIQHSEDVLTYAEIAFRVIGAADGQLATRGHKLVGCSDYKTSSHVILDCELLPGKYYVIANARLEHSTLATELELALNCDIATHSHSESTVRMTEVEQMDAWNRHLVTWYSRRVASTEHTLYDVGQNGAFESTHRWQMADAC